MLINEIISPVNEGSTDSYDINLLADFVADHLSQFIKKHPNTKIFTAKLLSRSVGVALPEMMSSDIQQLLTQRIVFQLTDSVKLASFAAFKGDHASNTPGCIKLNYTTLTNEHRLASAIAHEMQHAVDNEYSKGKALPAKDYRSQNYNDYVREPAEINARFAEVLYQLAKSHPTKETLEQTVNLLFRSKAIKPSLWDNTALAQKKMNRLKSRAYKFYDQVLSMPTPTDQTKQSWWDNKIKTLISKFI